MSDNIPIDIQIEIIKKFSDIKSLVQFRSVSKPWKSFIDSSEFITSYGARHTEPRSRILSYGPRDQDESAYIRLVDDDIQTFKVEQDFAPFVLSPSLKQCWVCKVVGTSHGLLCFYGALDKEWMILIWNPSIRKSFRINIASPMDLEHTVCGFGVSPVTKDPTVVKIIQTHDMPWDVEVFTLSSGVWNVIPSANLPRQSIQLDPTTQVVIDRFIYWIARKETNNRVVSFDLITKEFKVVDVPSSLTNELFMGDCSISKLRESLVIYGVSWVEGAFYCNVWVMERDSSFKKLFTIATHVLSRILGFSKSGEPIFEIPEEEEGLATLNVYDPRSQQFKNLGISGARNSFFMGSYKESLLLLDQTDSDLHIHLDDN